ncbi:MAG: OmpH family outer membrane protein [Planctomycetota bacterium]
MIQMNCALYHLQSGSSNNLKISNPKKQIVTSFFTYNMTQFTGRRNFLSNALAIGAVGAAGAAVASPASASSTQGPPAKHRFVNINKIVSKWDYITRQQDEFEKEFGQKMEQLQTRQTEIQKKRTALAELLKTGSSAQTRDQERTITIATGELEYDLKQLKNESTERRVRILLAAYQQIQEVAGKWAQQNKVDALFVVQEDDPADQDLVKRFERASVRQVLWYSPELDATEEILKLLQASAGPVPAVASRPATPPDKK